jgi:MFS family permease
MASNRSAVLTLISAYLGLFVGLIDANAVNLALPAIRNDLGGGISGAQWTIDAYNITFAAVLLTSGSLGDRFGRRTMLRVGLATFVAASLACAWRPHWPPRWPWSRSSASPRSFRASAEPPTRCCRLTCSAIAHWSPRSVRRSP